MPDVSSQDNYIEAVQIALNEKWDQNKIIWADVRKIFSLEDFVKGLLLFIFKFKEKKDNFNNQLLFAFIHCKPHQIIDIVRVLSIYYDKQGKNIRMNGVQIYLRGEEIGEEILFYGGNLREVSRNLAKSSCMRGLMFDNFQTVNKILERERRIEDNE